MTSKWTTIADASSRKWILHGVIKRPYRWHHAVRDWARNLRLSMFSSDARRWRLKQKAAQPGHYYGDGGTIHASGTIDIQMHKGKVQMVWFRCLHLPFTVSELDKNDSGNGAGSNDKISITGIEYQPADADD